MAATGTPTPNIGLRIPLGTDPASVDDINYNSNLIDTKLGPVGNDSVQDQIDDLNSNLQKKVDRASVGWSTSVSCDVTSSQAMVLINGSALFAVWLGGTSDVNVYRYPSYNVNAFVKTGQNSVTCGVDSVTGTDLTISRNGSLLTVTRASSSAIKIFT